MKWKLVFGALLVSAGLCEPSYGFEWLDRLIGIDLDNSEANSAYSPYSAGYAPYTVAYPAATGNGFGMTAPSCGCAPQTCYRTVYQPVPVTCCQPLATCDPCGNQVLTMRPVVTYRMQAQVVPYTANQPMYGSVPSYAPVSGGCATGNCGTGSP